MKIVSPRGRLPERIFHFPAMWLPFSDSVSLSVNIQHILPCGVIMKINALIDEKSSVLFPVCSECWINVRLSSSFVLVLFLLLPSKHSILMLRLILKMDHLNKSLSQSCFRNFWFLYQRNFLQLQTLKAIQGHFLTQEKNVCPRLHLPPQSNLSLLSSLPLYKAWYHSGDVEACQWSFCHYETRF